MAPETQLLSAVSTIVCLQSESLQRPNKQKNSVSGYISGIFNAICDIFHR